MVEAFINDSITSTLSSACVNFARRAIELTGDVDLRECNELDATQKIVNIRVMEQTIGAIIVSVSSVESMINELLSEPSLGMRSISNIPNITQQAYERWGRLWDQGVFERGNALEKCQLALEVADLSRLPGDSKEIQNLKALISLRNELVHSKPKFRNHDPDQHKDRDRLEKQLFNKFEENKLVSAKAPFIWQRCLGAGCAKWSVETEGDFTNFFYKALGINLQSEIDWG